MAVMLVVMIGKVNDWMPGLTWLPLAKVAFFFTVIYAYRARRSLVPVRVTSLRSAKPAIAFLVLSILSVCFSIYRSNTLIASESTLIYLITFVVLVKITQTLQDLQRMLLALALSAASLSIGLLVHFTGGRAHINDNFDPNDIAYVLDTLLPIVVALGAGYSTGRRWLSYGLAAATVLAILFTGSRGGEIGLGIVGLGMLAYPLSFTKGGELRPFSPGSMLVKLAFLGLLAVAVWSHLPDVTRERLTSLEDLQHDYSADSNLNSSRELIWRRDIELTLQRPIGYGMDAASAVDGRLAGGAYYTAHNSFVQAFVELGALGLLLFVYSYYVTWKELGTATKLGRQRPVDGHDPAKIALYARALRLALAGNIASGFFLSQAYSPCLWELVAICASFVRIVGTSPISTGERATVSEPIRAGTSS
jgi:O-antigen ligase